MDDFFVAKIQKLSDRKPEDTLELEESDPDGQNETSKKEKAVENKKVVSEEKATPDAADEKPTKKSRSDHLSVPPIKQNTNKNKKMNAKVTKPRRNKANAQDS